jgi:hypothetical protein
MISPKVCTNLVMVGIGVFFGSLLGHLSLEFGAIVAIFFILAGGFFAYVGLKSCEKDLESIKHK